MDDNSIAIWVKIPWWKRSLYKILSIIAFCITFPVPILLWINKQILWVKLRYLEYIPRQDDIFIVTYPRSGTTWLQMILYQLTSDGAMDFFHISEHIPWFENFNLNNNRKIENLPSPRIFKTHLAGKGFFSIPKSRVKIVYVTRDGRDVAVSYYHFQKDYMRFKGNFDHFFERFMQGRLQFGSWFKHVQSWKAYEHLPNFLFLEYETLKSDLPGSIRKIAQFCGLSITEDRFEEIVQNSSIEFMKQYELKFDWTREMLIQFGVQASAFIRTGQIGGWQGYFSEDQLKRFESRLLK